LKRRKFIEVARRGDKRMPSDDKTSEKKDDGSIAIPVESESKIGGKKKKNGKDKVDPDEMSEEDKALKEGLELAVLRLQEPDKALHKQALDHLSSEIRSATSSMTSVPKPLKFLRPFFDALKKVYESWNLDHPMKESMADVMSVLAMTMAPQGSRECLKFKLSGSQVNVSSWGHEYVRALSGEISEEYNKRTIEVLAEDETDVDDLMTLVDDIVPFQMKHNAEAEAIDLLMEVQQLSKLLTGVDDRNYERVCLYLLRCTDFVTDPDDLHNLLTNAYTIYKNQKKYTDALRVALKMDEDEKIAELFGDETPEISKKQMAFILGRCRSSFTLEDETLNEIIGNTGLSERY
jgi:26S proteasome regulatory subunit N1